MSPAAFAEYARAKIVGLRALCGRPQERYSMVAKIADAQFRLSGGGGW